MEVFTLESCQGERIELCPLCYSDSVNNPRDSLGLDYDRIIRGPHHGTCAQCKPKPLKEKTS